MLHIPDFQCPPPHSDSKHTQPFPLDTRNKCSWQFYDDRFAIDSINDGTQWLAKHYLVWQICKCTRRYYQPMTGTGWCMKTSGRLQEKNFSDYMKFYTTFIKVNYMHKNAKSLHRDNMKYEDSTKWGTKTWGQCFALRQSFASRSVSGNTKHAAVWCVSFYIAPEVQTPLNITSGSESRPISIILISILMSRECTFQVVFQTDGIVCLILVH